MVDAIRVLVVDDIADTRDHISKLLSFESDLEVVGSAVSGLQAVDLAARLQPDVVLMDINMPDVDGITATEQLVRRAPDAAVVMMSVQGEPDYLRRAMVAGAREYLVKPFSSDELVASIRHVHDKRRDHFRPVAMGPGQMSVVPPAQPKRTGTVVALFSPKGGVGRSTIAANLAVAARAELDQSVVLVDGGFQFGDIGLLLNLKPNSSTIADVLADVVEGNPEAVDTSLVEHASGIRVLLAPPSPEMAELVTPEHVRKIVKHLRQGNDLIVIDCPATLQEPTLTLLDAADVLLCVLTLDLTSIKNTRLFLGVAEQLGYGADKVQVVLNRADAGYGISVADVERSIGHKVDHTIVSDARMVVQGLNRGMPFVSLNRGTMISQDIIGLAKSVAGVPIEQEAPVAPRAAPRRLALSRR
jgi:pilus assembly protein CpaE